jgi:hypothetical protein
MISAGGSISCRHGNLPFRFFSCVRRCRRGTQLRRVKLPLIVVKREGQVRETSRRARKRPLTLPFRMAILNALCRAPTGSLLAHGRTGSAQFVKQRFGGDKIPGAKALDKAAVYRRQQVTSLLGTSLFAPKSR